MSQENQPQIFFHVGLGKTASTYLQYEVFPKLQGIHYIQRTRYNQYQEIIKNSKADKHLISREFDRQYFNEVGKMAKFDPNARIIIVLRRNESWIASQYRRYVKNGGFKTFSEFLDLENNEGWWEKEEVYFYPKLQYIEENFNHKPLVLFHDELKHNPYQFIKRIVDYTGTTFDKNKISLKPSHKSYSTKQLLIIRDISKKIFKSDEVKAKTKTWHYIKFRSRWLLCHLILYAANLASSSITKRKELIPESELEKVRNIYGDDWQKCLEFTKNNSYDPSALDGLKNK
jgi:hypothetical protein